MDDDITDSLWKSLLQESVTFLHDVDRVFSPFRKDSYLTLVEKNDSEPQVVDIVKPNDFQHYVPFVSSTFTSEALKAYEYVESLCAAAQWKSNGAFNAWRNETYDPIGLVKGWAADYVIEILRSYGITRAFVNAGGDIACMTSDEPWRIAVENPSDTMTALGFLEISNGALCTSGTYEKGEHIQKRNNQSDFVSVTISGPSAALADAFATAVIADGLEAFDWFQTLGDDWGVIAISHDGTSIYSNGWTLEGHEFKRL